MSLKLFELVGTDASRPFSPYCWRTQMALAHKGLTAESVPWRFTEKSTIAPHGSERVPVLLHHEKPVVDSWAIANYLEDNFPDRPSLFGGQGGRAMARTLNAWGDIAIVGGIFPLIVADIPEKLDETDAAYFRKSREARFGGKTLEEVMASRDTAVIGFRKSLEVMRQTLKKQPFIGGSAPNYADYIVFGGFQWGAGDQPVQAARTRGSGLCLARKAARCVRRHGAEIAGTSSVRLRATFIARRLLP